MKNKYIQRLKEKVIQEASAHIVEGEQLVYIPTGMSQAEYQLSDLYHDYTNYYSSDGIKQYANHFFISNVRLIKKIGESKKIRFTGIVGYQQLKEGMKDVIIIKPSYENKYVNSFRDDQNKLMGNAHNRVYLENNQFNNYFEVYATDQIKAREIITMDYMERLVMIRSKLNAPIKIIYKGNRKYIAIWNQRIIEEKRLYQQGIKLEGIVLKLKGIYKILDVI